MWIKKKIISKFKFQYILNLQKKNLKYFFRQIYYVKKHNYTYNRIHQGKLRFQMLVQHTLYYPNNAWLGNHSFRLLLLLDTCKLMLRRDRLESVKDYIILLYYMPLNKLNTRLKFKIYLYFWKKKKILIKIIYGKINYFHPSNNLFGICKDQHYKLNQH